MCVIALIEYVRPSADQVSQMFEANKHGAGVAWRDLNTAGEPVVKWKKGITDKDEMVELANTLPLPHVLHFRIPSPQTSSSYLACHPFQVDEHATTGWEGETTGSVLFHNGHWMAWRERLQQISISGFVRIPAGPWSDSRALAWTTHHLGLGFLDLLDEKVVVFGPNQYDVEMYGNWFEVKMGEDLEDGTPQTFLVTNKSWEHTTYSPHIVDRRRHADATNIHRNTPRADSEQPGGVAQQSPFPCSLGGTYTPPGLGRDEWRDKQEPIQKADARVGEGSTDPATEETALTAVVAGIKIDKCHKCGKETTSGDLNVEKKEYLCWQCWANRPSRRRAGWIQKCETCKVAKTATLTRVDHKWICTPCWEVTGRPLIVFMRELEEVTH